MTYLDAIRLVEDGTAGFCIVRAGLRAELLIVNNTGGYKCVRAKEDRGIEVLLTLRLQTSERETWNVFPESRPPAARPNRR